MCRRERFQALLLYHLDSEDYGTKGTIVGRLPSIRDRGQAHLKFELIKRRSPKEFSAESLAVTKEEEYEEQPVPDDGRIHVYLVLYYLFPSFLFFFGALTNQTLAQASVTKSNVTFWSSNTEARNNQIVRTESLGLLVLADINHLFLLSVLSSISYFYFL